MAKQKKLNSMRWLEQRNIPYTVYEFDANLHSAQAVAEFLCAPPQQIFKTLVVITTNARPLLVLLNAVCTLDLKLLAAAAGQKKLQMATHEDAEKLTGLQTGGISALALTAKNWPIYLDVGAMKFEEIYMSAGKRGVNLLVPRQAFVEACNVKVVECCSPIEGNF